MEENTTQDEVVTPEVIVEFVPEDPAMFVETAFDSVDLIENINSMSSIDEETAATKERNLKHLTIMMGKKWFVDVLTEEQKVKINQLI